MDLFNTIKNKNLPEDFNTKYSTYLQNPLIWLLPLDNENKIKSNISVISPITIITFLKNLFDFNFEKDDDGKYHLNFKINNDALFNDDIISYYEKLLCKDIDEDKISLEYIFTKYGIYYDIATNSINSISINITDSLATLIQIVMNVVLKQSTFVKTMNTQMKHYYKNVYSSLFNNFFTDNSFDNSKNIFALIKSSKGKLPFYSNETAKLYTKELINNLNLNNHITVIPKCIIEAINTNDIKAIAKHFNETKFNVNDAMITVNKYNKIANKLATIKCNTINKITKDELSDMITCNKLIVDYKDIKEEDIDEMNDEEKEKYVNNMCYVGNIEYMLKQ